MPLCRSARQSFAKSGNQDSKRSGVILVEKKSNQTFETICFISIQAKHFPLLQLAFWYLRTSDPYFDKSRLGTLYLWHPARLELNTSKLRVTDRDSIAVFRFIRLDLSLAWSWRHNYFSLILCLRVGNAVWPTIPVAQFHIKKCLVE